MPQELWQSVLQEKQVEAQKSAEAQKDREQAIKHLVQKLNSQEFDTILQLLTLASREGVNSDIEVVWGVWHENEHRMKTFIIYPTGLYVRYTTIHTSLDGLPSAIKSSIEELIESVKVDKKINVEGIWQKISRSADHIALQLKRKKN